MFCVLFRTARSSSLLILSNRALETELTLCVVPFSSPFSSDSNDTASVPNTVPPGTIVLRMDFNSLKDSVSNLTLYDLKAGVRKVQNGKSGIGGAGKRWEGRANRWMGASLGGGRGQDGRRRC